MYACDYVVRPLVVRADRETEIRATPRFDHAAPSRDANWRLEYVREDGALPGGGYEGYGGWRNVPFRFRDGALVFRHRFAGEGEHTFRLSLGEGADPKTATFHLYSAEDDLFALRPFRGDFHIHSNCSDGRGSPAFVAATCRKAGMDFIALADHRRREASIEAMKAMAKLPTDLVCHPGEEVHAPGAIAHVVAFGARRSITKCFADEKAFQREIDRRERAGGYSAELTAFERRQVAATEWVYEKIRACGGVAVHCHPYWRPCERFHLPGRLAAALLERQQFDVLELLNGCYQLRPDLANLAVSDYIDARARGQRIPVAALGDSHAADGVGRWPVGGYHTLVFARSTAFADLAEALRGERSVAVEALPGQFPRIHGPTRLVRYAYFLQREFFPEHDVRCRREGELLLEALAGDASALKALRDLRGAVPALWRECWKP